jgi:hypothetical protein
MKIFNRILGVFKWILLILSVSTLLGCTTDLYEEHCTPYVADSPEVIRERVLFQVKSLQLGDVLECVSIQGAGSDNEACAIRLNNQNVIEQLRLKGYTRNETTFLPEGVKQAAAKINAMDFIAYYENSNNSMHSIYVNETQEYAIIFVPNNRCLGEYQITTKK